MKSLLTLLLLVALSTSSQLLAQSTIEDLVEQTGIEEGDVAVRELPRWREPQKILVRDILGVVALAKGLLPGVEIVGVASEQEAVEHAAGADAIIGYCSERLVAAASDVVWIQIFSAGAEYCVNIDRIRDGDILLTNMQKMSSPVIGEHVTAMILALARGLVSYSKAMPEGKWRRRSDTTSRMVSADGKTVLVLGLGGIGTEAARRAAALNMRVIGTRRSSREGPEFVDYVGLASEMHELAGEADFIVNALPITPETEGLLDAEFFTAARRGAFFINVGRGKTVVTDDLVAALESGQIAGAGLDVTDPEPLPPEHPLWQMDNVIITPHVSSRGSDRSRHMALAAENLRRFVAGDALFNVVDPEHGY